MSEYTFKLYGRLVAINRIKLKKSHHTFCLAKKCILSEKQEEATNYYKELIVSKGKVKNNWQILRKMFKYLKTNLTSLNKKDNDLIFVNATRIANFKNFISFQFYATQNLTNLGFYLATKTRPFALRKKNTSYKQRQLKVLNTKMKYWLDDFFSGGKDEYSQNSLVLTNCSKILRAESSNFF